MRTRPLRSNPSGDESPPFQVFPMNPWLDHSLSAEFLSFLIAPERKLRPNHETTTKPQSNFHYELFPPEENLDSRGNTVTTIHCHGQIMLETRDQIKEIFQSTPFHGRIIFDLSDVDYLDSAGLGALISCKLSAAKQGGVSVTYAQITARVLQ